MQLIRATLKASNLANDISGRYLMEIGTTSVTPPRGTLLQAIGEARAGVMGRLKEWLYSTSILPVSGELSKDQPSFDKVTEMDDNIPDGSDLLFVLRVSSRHLVDAGAVGMLLHSYIVNAALWRIYSNMGQGELAKMHSEKLTVDIDAINSMMYKKVIPVYDEE